MRVRLFVVLLAFVAMAAIPSEAVLAQEVGSVVGQVASCVEPSGLLREGAGRTDVADGCDAVAPVVAAPVVVAVLCALALALLLQATRARSHLLRVDSQRWRLGDALARSGAPWRAPPRAA